MKKEIQNCITWLINKTSETIIYDDWSKEQNKKVFDMFYQEMKKHIDFNNITSEEAKELRFRKFSEEYPNLWLFPLYLVPLIPEGLDVMSISGEKYKYNKEKADNDIRFGCVAYGIEIKN